MERAYGRSDQIDDVWRRLSGGVELSRDGWRRRGRVLKPADVKLRSVGEEVLELGKLRAHMDVVAHDGFELREASVVGDLGRRGVAQRGVDGSRVGRAGPSEVPADFVDEVLLDGEGALEAGDVMEDVERGSTEIVKLKFAIPELEESMQHVANGEISACGLADSGIVVKVGEQAFAVHVHVVEARVALMLKVTKEAGPGVDAFDAADSGDAGPAVKRCTQQSASDGLLERVKNTLNVFEKDVAAVDVGAHGHFLAGAVGQPLVVGPRLRARREVREGPFADVEVHDGLPLVAVALAAVQHDRVEHVPEGPHDVIAGNHIAEAREGNNVRVGLVVKVGVAPGEGGAESTDGRHDGVEFGLREMAGLLEAVEHSLVTLWVLGEGLGDSGHA